MAVKKQKKKAKVEEVVELKPIDHVLVPKVDVLTDEQVKTVLDKYKMSLGQFPLINSSDPAIAFLKLKPGNVVKFSRKSLVSGEESPYCRLVVGE